MTIADFRRMIESIASERMEFEAYRDYLKQQKESRTSNPNKYLREEYLPLCAVFTAKKIQDEEEISLGNETEKWDAKFSNGELYEVVQALPDNEHDIRLGIASGGADPATYFQHSADHLQFPQAIVNAIQLKHDMHYTEPRTLVVAVDGDYTSENDEIIYSWIENVRPRAELGIFKEILLVERARLKVFKIL